MGYRTVNREFIIPERDETDGRPNADEEQGVSEAADMTLDVRGFACPLPILKARKALVSLGAGAILEVLSTEPQSVADFEAFCGVSGHTLLAQSTSGGTYRFLIRKGG
jgi:tRNA 2-thiouridine synthesizing protein A